MSQTGMAVLMLLLGWGLVLGSGGEAQERRLTVHVAPQGNDAWSGALSAPNATRTDGPLASLTRARDRVREIKKAPGTPPPSVIIEVQGGVYEMAAALELTAEDSGTVSRPVTIRAARGQTVRLVGGRVITGFQPVTDPAVLQRLEPQARGKVRQTDLNAQGLQTFSEMKNATTWGSSSPGLEVFFADQPMTLARWPNEGYTRIVNHLGKTEMDIRGTKGTKEGVFSYEGDRPRRWVDEPELMANGFWMWDWADQRYRVKSIDLDQRIITLDDQKNPHSFGFRKGQWFYIYNALSELDQPGEWYLDRQRGILYFWPPAPLSRGQVLISATGNLLQFKAASNISVQGLTLEACQGVAVTINGGEGCQLAACTIRNTGGGAVSISGGTRHEVFGCEMYNMADGGVSVTGGDRKTLTPAGHNVENNHIHHYSRWNPVYKAAINLQGVGNRAAHNLIHNAPHMAIGFGGNDHVIEYNEIHSVVYESNDAGVMYCGYNWTMRGHQIRHNYVHHIYGFQGRGCVGVYLDDQFSSAHIFGNIFYKVPAATFIGGGRDTIIENNIFVDCNPAVHVDSRGLGWQQGGVTTLTNRLQEMPYQEEPWRSRYPQLLTLLEDQPGAPRGNLITRNICAGGRWERIDGKARPGVTLVDNLLDQDPLFVDKDKSDFRLKPESPAFNMGFKPIPSEKIGLYEHRLRAVWPVTHEVRPAPALPPQVASPTRQLPPVTVPKAAQTAVIDGQLTPGEWPEVVLTLQEDPGRVKIQGAPATARVMHDGAHLYVAVTVPLKKRAALKPGADWGKSDGAEVCFRAAAARRTPAFVLHGFANGHSNSDEQAGVTPQAARTLGLAVRYAARVTDTHWTGEWAIPLAAAGLAYQPGLQLAFNAGVWRNETGEWIIWSGALGPTWQVENGGVLVLQ